MPTTSNFGWTTPADTDLVKDGAAAIRTLGNGIDTSLVDLKGGTTGQILSKASNTDLDYTWITNDVGDITAVTAGTGISGGGTSGAVTITNSMATEITAAGDIIVGTGSATFDNLPIGTTGQVLTADTTVSPYKVKWATPGATYETGTFTPDVKNSSSSSTWSVKSGVYTKIGRMVFASIKCDSGNSGTAGSVLTLTGLPFTVSNATYIPLVQVARTSAGSADTQFQGVFDGSNVIFNGTDGTSRTAQATFFLCQIIYYTA